MSNLARYFKNLGKKVSGTIKRHLYYNELIESGISIHFEDDIHAIQRFYLENTLVIITPAVRRHIQVELFLRKRLSSKKKSGGFRNITKILLFCRCWNAW
jgi:UDP-N-acetylmuramate--alanine ligase